MNWRATSESSFAVSSKVRIPCNPALLDLSAATCPEELLKDVPKKVFAGMFMTASLMIANVLKHPKCLSGEWIDNLGCAPEVEYPAELTCLQG